VQPVPSDRDADVARRQLLRLGLMLPGAAALAACSSSSKPSSSSVPTSTPTSAAASSPPPAPAGAPTTLEHTLLRGTPGRLGFVPLVSGAGESHSLRTDLGGTPSPQRTTARRPLLAFAQLTDIHTVDAQSPARVEFLDRADDPPSKDTTFTAAYRPQEMLTAHVADTMAATVRSVGHGPVTRLPLAFAVSTGDAVDNCQANELRWMIDLLDGGRRVRPDSGDTSQWEGVHDSDAANYDVHYWHPAVPPPGKAADAPKATYGFPTVPDLLNACRRPFTSTGLGIPWYAAYGNHDGLVQGNAVPQAALNAVATGDRKVTGLSPGMSALAFATLLLAGRPIPSGLPSRTVTADPQRRLVSRRETIEAHFDTAGSPAGHGFTETNRRQGTAYYRFDPTAAVRCVVLDTVNPGGLSDGSLDATQFAWLESELSTAGSRLVVLFSHHTIATMVNGALAPGEKQPRVLGPAVRDMLLRHPQVVLWVNGHTHINRVTAYKRAGGGGFWEVNTAAHIDWPQQSRLVEIVDNHDGTLSVFGTILDFAAPPAGPGRTGSPSELAALSRLLAANDWQERTGHSATVDGRRGKVEDRNVELFLPDPRAAAASQL